LGRESHKATFRNPTGLTALPRGRGDTRDRRLGLRKEKAKCVVMSVFQRPAQENPPELKETERTHRGTGGESRGRSFGQSKKTIPELKNQAISTRKNGGEKRKLLVVLLVILR